MRQFSARLSMMSTASARRWCSLRSLQRGQAMLEYAIVGGVLASALFLVEVSGKTGAQYLTEMIRAFFRNLTYYLSLP